MAADNSTITRKRGDDYSIFLELTDEDDLPIPLTNVSAVFSVSDKREPTTAVYLFQITGVVFGNEIDGVFEFPLTTQQADNLGKFYYDIQVTDAAGKKRTVANGVIIFKQDITK